jgi:two-component system, NarL family, response regulator DesR
MMTTPDVQQTLRVMFVDDNVLAARALERWFGCAPGIHFVGWAGDVDTAVTAPAGGHPDIILLDLEMPGVDTVGLIPRLLQAHSGSRVVMLSGHVRPEDIGRTLDAGAAGYICKDEPTAVIAGLVRRAAQGDCVLSPLAQRAFMGGR